MGSIIRKLKKEGVNGHDIVILSNFRLDNKNNFISELNLSGTYDHVVDLTDNNIRNLSSNIDEIKKCRKKVDFFCISGLLSVKCIDFEILTKIGC